MVMMGELMGVPTRRAQPEVEALRATAGVGVSEKSPRPQHVVSCFVTSSAASDLATDLDGAEDEGEPHHHHHH